MVAATSMNSSSRRSLRWLLFAAVLVTLWSFRRENSPDPSNSNRGPTPPLLSSTGPTATKSQATAETAWNHWRTQLPASKSPIQDATEWPANRAEPFEKLRAWQAQYRAATDKAALEAEGVTLAQSRRAAMAKWIERDPEFALTQAVGPDARRDLPAAVLAQLERWIEGLGGLEVVVRCGPNVKTSEQFTRTVRVGGEEFKAFVYGRRLGQTTRYDLPVHGVAVDDKLALHSSPVRQLEPGELQVRGLDAQAIHLETGGEVTYAAHAQDAFAIETRLLARESGRGPYPMGQTKAGQIPAGLPPGTAAFPPSPGWTLGQKRVLVIFADFSDDIGALMTTNAAHQVMTNVNRFYLDNSQGQTSIQPTYFPVTLRLPQTKAAYANLDPMTDLRADSLAAARLYDQQNGNTGAFNPDNYDLDTTVFTSITGANYGFAGLAFVGAKGMVVNGEFDLRVMAHELGHNYGLQHANRWDVTGVDPIDPAGTHNEYGDDYDMMGANNNDQSIHFNEWFKAYLGWLNTSNWRTAPTGGVYRLFRHDHTNAGGIRGLTLGQQPDRAYWLGFRRNLSTYTANGSGATNFLANGVEIRWGMQPPGITSDMTVGSRLLNFTTATTNFTRHPLPIGQTFTDTNFNVSITPLSVGGTSPNDFIDLNISYAAAPVTITQNPTNQTASVGSTVAFNVAVTGTGLITYQWTYNGVNIPGATSSNYTIANVTTNQGGTYLVRVTNPGGTINSQPATLTVTSVTVSASGLLAHWKFDEAPGSTVTVDSAGNFNGTNSLTGATFVPGGRSGNALSLDISANGLVNMGNVLMLGASDFTISGWVKSPPGDSTVDATFASKHNTTFANGFFLGYNHPAIANGINHAHFFAGTRLISSGGFTIADLPVSTTTVNDGNWHQIVGVYRPAGNTTVYVDGAPMEGSIPSSAIASNNAPFLIGATTAGGIPTGVFNGLVDDVQVYNRALTDGEIDFLFLNPGQEIGLPGAPVITSPPQNISVVQGGSATFSVTATGTAPLTYQWLFNGGTIPGATGTNLTLLSVQATNAGNYSVRVSNTIGTNTSAAATLSVSTLAPIAHWKFDEAPGSTVAVNSVGSVNGTLSATGADFVPGGRAGNALSLNLAANGIVNFGTNFGFTNDFTVSAWIKTAPGDTTASGNFLSKHNSSSANGYILSYNWPFRPANKAIFYAGTRFEFGTFVDVPPSTSSVNDGGWHQIVGVYNASGNTTIYVDGAPVEGSIPSSPINPNAAPFLVGGVLLGGVPTAMFTGLVDDVQLYNRALNDSEIDFLFQNPGSEISGAPFITTPPQSTSVVLSNNVTFTVTNSGIAPFSYQWRFNGVNINGATSPTLTLNNVQTNQAGLYSVRVDNSAGFAISTNATLTVLVPAFVVTQPTNRTVLAGSNVTLVVAPGGTPPFSYQWRFNNVDIQGATAPSLLVPNAQFANQGSYSVLVSNPYGSSLSSNAMFTVNSPPVVTAQPGNRVTSVAAPVSFSVGVGGNAPFTYQWRFNGIPISGATGSVYGISGVVSAHTGIYSVAITNAYGNTASSNATLSVIPARVLSNWGATAGGAGADVANAVTVDLNGNAFVVGYFTGTATFGTNQLVSAGVRDGFLTKYSSTGQLLWVRRVGGTGFDTVNAVAVDPSGNCYLAGSYEGVATFGLTSLTNTSASSFPDAFVAKFDANGTNVWARSLGVAASADTASAVALDGAGNVFVAGQSTLGTFNSVTLTNHGRVFIAKYDNAGAPQWARKAGGGGAGQFDQATALAADSAGNVYLAGVFSSATANFDGGSSLANRGGSDAFVARFNAAGGVQWVQQIGGAQDDRANGLAVDSNGNAYVVGEFTGTLELPGTSLATAVTDQNAFIARFDPTGAVTWARQMGGTLADSARAVTVDASNQVFIAGYFSGAAAFGSETLVSVANTYDAFIARLDTNGTFAFAQQAGGSDLGGDFGLGVAVDSAGNALLAGYFNGAGALGSNSATSVGAEDIFVTRFRPFTGDTPPPLNFAPIAGQLRLSWPLNSSSFILQVAPDLRSQSWRDAVGVLGVEATEFAMTNQVTLTNRFFRLRKP